MKYEGKIGILKDALTREFGFGAATVERLFTEIIGYPEKEKCINCGAGMKEYTDTFDAFNAKLLMEMGRVVIKRLRAGKPISEANRVHVQSLDGIDYAMKSRTTLASKLGLIAKYRDENKKHVRGTWLITARGFAALRNESVPKKVVIFRSKIMERSDETTTLSEASKDYKDGEWVEIAGYAKGALL